MIRLVKILSVVLVLVLLAGIATAKFSTGEQNKLRKWFTVIFDPAKKDKDRTSALEDLNDFLDNPKKLKELADVEMISELLALSVERPSQGRTGLLEREWNLKDLGATSNEKFRYAVSIPKKYSGSDSAEPWPLILCIPEKGQTPKDYIDTYWKDPEIREQYLIVALEFSYADFEVTRTVERNVGGKVQLRTIKEKEPFSWDSKPAARTFWANLYNLQMREFKIDPDRIVLDGAGFGSTGAVYFGAGTTRLFAGLIIRGGVLDKPIIENLLHIPVLSQPYASKDEAFTRAQTALTNAEEERKAAADTLEKAEADLVKAQEAAADESDESKLALGAAKTARDRAKKALDDLQAQVDRRKAAVEAIQKFDENLKATLAKGLTIATDGPEWSGAGEEGAGAELLKWLQGCARNRYPLPSKWVVADDAHQCGYWFFVTRLHNRFEPATISIQGDERRRDRVEITCENVAEFTLYLNDLLVDLDKTFDLYINGEKVRTIVKERSVDQLIRHAMVGEEGLFPHEPGVVIVEEVRDISVQAPPEEEKPEEGAEKKEGDEEKKEGDEKEDAGEKKEGDGKEDAGEKKEGDGKNDAGEKKEGDGKEDAGEKKEGDGKEDAGEKKEGDEKEDGEKKDAG